jgi:hypothetical protein
MIGKLSSEIEKEIDKKGFHILRKSFAKNKMYPNQFPEYSEIDEIGIGKKYSIRLFVKHIQNGIEIIDSGMIDVEIQKINNDKYSSKILTLLPSHFPIRKGDSIFLTKDEILYEQE